MAFSIVQSQHGNGTSTSATISCSTTGSGNLLVAIIAAAKNPGAVSITPPSGWTQIGSTQDDPAYIEISAGVFYQEDCASGSTSFTWTLGSTPSQWDGILLEISGAATSSPLDASNVSNTQSFHTSDSVSVTTTASGELLIGIGVWDAVRVGAPTSMNDGSGYSSILTFSDGSGWLTVHAAQQTQSGSGSVSYAPSWTGSMDDIVWLLAFKAGITTSTRTATAEASLLQTSTRSATSNATFLQQLTRTGTSSASLLQKNTRTGTSEAALLQQLTRTATSEAALLQRHTNSATADASLLQKSTRTAVAEAALLQTNTRTSTVNAALLQTNTRTGACSASLIATRTALCEASLLQKSTRTAMCSASLSTTGSIPATNAILYVRSGKATLYVRKD
jgi:hypothetical protein